VASENNDSEDRAESSHEPRECMACRGTGRVISNLGGTPSTVTCPWCEGGGMRVPGIDAQERWLGESVEHETRSDSPDSPE
jgi:DnaJ-class molecular chaperone